MYPCEKESISLTSVQRFSIKLVGKPFSLDYNKSVRSLKSSSIITWPSREKVCVGPQLTKPKNPSIITWF